jgi:hypothetical protein
VDASLPDFEALEAMYRREIAGLSDAQLDWEDPAQEWSRWSIRRQVSHVALAYFFWFAKMWGKTLWPGDPPPDPVDFRKALVYDRRLDEERYWRLEDLLPKFSEALALARRAAGGRTPEERRTLTLTRTFPSDLKMGQTDLPVYRFWSYVSTFHEDGIAQHPEDETTFTFTLEGMLRHMHWEALVHLRTIQRLKAAQGLPPSAPLSRTGYLLDPFFWGSEDTPAF